MLVAGGAGQPVDARKVDGNESGLVELKMINDN